MPDIRCPHCGKENPDFLDVCQFCQNPLKPTSSLRIGQNPTKRDTGELEGVLPDWLKNARKQARDGAEEDAAQAAAQPKVQKEGPPDLLAGLAFQSESTDDEEVPDWLSSINPVAGKPTAPAAPVQPEPENDFFAQLNRGTPAKVTLPSTPTNEPVQSPSAEPDELSAWLSHAAEQTSEPFAFEQDTSTPHSDWGIRDVPAATEPAPKAEEEDLSWLHNLETASKQTDQLRQPQPNMDWESDLNSTTQFSEPGDLDWLNSLGAINTPEQKTSPPVTTSQPQDDRSWLNDLGGTASSTSTPSSDDDLSWLNNLGGQPAEQPSSPPVKPQAVEDLNWLKSFGEAQAPSQQEPPSASQEDLGWLRNFDVPAEASTPTAKPQEDLSWLKNFESAPAGSSPLQSQPPEDLGWLKDFESAPAESASSAPQSQPQEDLGWLKNFDATPAEQSAPTSEIPQDDLNWLSAFGDASAPAEATPASSGDDLGWLNNLGATPAESVPANPEAPQGDLSWLSAFGATPQPSQPAASDDLGWLSNLQGEPDILPSVPFEQDTSASEGVSHVSPFSPAKTAPLDENSEISIPDWLKSATEAPSMPMGVQQLDQFREDFKIPSQPEEPFSWKSFTQETRSADEAPRSTPEPAPVDPGLSAPTSRDSIPSNEDVNSVFSMEMPDWLSQEPAKEEDISQSIGINAEGGEALSPVDLPSWVQAMRPMDAVISEAIASTADLPTEHEGPLAGFRGVIPTAPVGSARRPKPVSLKLQVSDEQQSSAALLEQLLAAETSPRSVPSAPVFSSQRPLRWALSALLLLVLSAVLTLRTQMFATSAVLPAAAQGSTAVIQGIPEGSNVLVVVDYEPALAGEMEAVSGPVLDQLALSRHPSFSFVSTSPNGPALVERLMNNTNISKTSAGGLGYTSGQNYFNLGYLPGAETGVLTFIQSPQTALPLATVGAFSDYSAVVVLTDNANTARTWVEQLQNAKQADAAFVHQTLLVASSAQAGPLLQPYVSSQQIDGLITGLADASRFEFVNNSRPGIVRSYWDAFSTGLILAVVLMSLGSLWSITATLRTRRAEAAEE